MIECTHCGGKCGDDALYCVHCGERLDTAACRKCGNYLPKEVKYCAHCGYPSSGSVCPKCKKQNPDDAKFCLECGAVLSVASETQSVAVMPRVKTKSDKKAFAVMLTRVFVLPLLLAAMFVSSFFGMFMIDTGDETMAVNGFDAVRGMFLLINPPAEEDVADDFSEYYDEYLIRKGVDITKVSDAKKEKLYKEALTRFGILRSVIYDGNVTNDMTAQVVLWGLQSLALMVITFVFFVLSLTHALFVVTKRKTGAYRFETPSLALVTALAFAFIITGGVPAAASVAMWLLGALGHSGVIAYKYYVEKAPRPDRVTILRRGICAALVVLTAVFGSIGLVGTSYTSSLKDVGLDTDGKSQTYEISAMLDASDLYDGMDDYLDKIEDRLSETVEIPDVGSFEVGAILEMAGIKNLTTAADLDKLTALLVALPSSDLNRKDKATMLRLVASPSILCKTDEARKSFDAPATALSWLLYFSDILFAAMITVTLFQMFREEAEPEKKRKVLLWHILSFVGMGAIIGCSVPYIVMGNYITKSLSLGFKFTVSAFPIVAAVLGLATVAVSAVMTKLGSGKGKDKTPTPVETDAEQSDLMQI